MTPQHPSKTDWIQTGVTIIAFIGAIYANQQVLSTKLDSLKEALSEHQKEQFASLSEMKGRILSLEQWRLNERTH